MAYVFYPESYLNHQANQQQAYDSMKRDAVAFEQSQKIQAAQEQRAAEDARNKMIEIARQRLAEDQARRTTREGAAAYTGYLRNPEMTPGGPIPGASAGVQSATEALAAAGAPQVGLIPQLRKPEMAPFSIDRLAQSIHKQNPQITPEGMVAALERFAPQLEQADKMKLAQLKMRSTGSNTMEKMIYQQAIDAGLSPDDAMDKALAYKRANPEEVAKVEAAKTKGKGEVTPQEEKATGKDQLNTIISDLAGSYDELNNMGGIVSTERTPGQNIVARAQTSGLGQFIGGAVGSNQQMVLDKIAQSRPLLINAIRKATGMSAKNMDSNAELQFYLSAATDPTRGIQANRAALQRLKELYIDGGAVPENAAAPAAAPKTINFADLPD